MCLPARVTVITDRMHFWRNCRCWRLQSDSLAAGSVRRQILDLCAESGRPAGEFQLHDEDPTHGGGPVRRRIIVQSETRTVLPRSASDSDFEGCERQRPLYNCYSNASGAVSSMLCSLTQCA